MRIIYIILLFILIGCKPAELRIKEYSYTDYWYYQKEQRYQVYQTKLGNKYILVPNKRQDKLVRKYIR